MMNLKHAALLILSAAIATGASAAGPTGERADFGVAVANTAAERTIEIKPKTKHVNVVDGETVKFAVDGKEFSWHFRTWPSTNQFALEKIAPRDTQANGVTVHVARNPTYFSN
ncbi:CzcE family metal-binding protein [Massilia sp. RP-1-19]|uniref:CzcE family metal-binding protein n=1 Tax=Massilia polaris TaxID=2728846 RepID=A0A848HDE8_9BURK|nr:CzcE family metal-binding protein [Massilia polaris]NML59846.1 CzcE family metal-binding protein [Massilia polaris]